MSNYSSKDVGFILVDGFSLLGSVTSIQDSVEAILQEITALGDAWARFASTGIRKGALSQSGFYDDAAGQVNQALVDTEVGATRVFCYNLNDNVIGQSFVGFAGAIEAKYERGIAMEKFHTANATYSPSGNIENGVILHALVAETAAGDTKASSVDHTIDPRAVAIPITSASVANPTVITTPVPHGLVSGDKVVISGMTGETPTVSGEYTVTVTGTMTFTVPLNVTIGGTGGQFVQSNTDNGGAAYLQVSALVLGGFTNFAPKVQHSADNATWVDLATFTVVTASPTAQRVVVTPGTTVNRYLAAIWAFGGSGSGESVTFFVGFSRA